MAKLNVQQIVNGVEAKFLKKEIPPVRIGDNVKVGVKIIEGNKDSPQVIKDIWVFQKPLKSKNPAWELILTNPDD